jgi:hypothetical protein
MTRFEIEHDLEFPTCSIRVSVNFSNVRESPAVAQVAKMLLGQHKSEFETTETPFFDDALVFLSKMMFRMIFATIEELCSAE